MLRLSNRKLSSDRYIGRGRQTDRTKIIPRRFENGRSRRKHERTRVASLPVCSVFKNCNKLTLKQFIVNYTSASGSLNFGMIIMKYFLVAPKFIQSHFIYISRFSMHNIIIIIVNIFVGTCIVLYRIVLAVVCVCRILIMLTC